MANNITNTSLASPGVTGGHTIAEPSTKYTLSTLRTKIKARDVLLQDAVVIYKLIRLPDNSSQYTLSALRKEIEIREANTNTFLFKSNVVWGASSIYYMPGTGYHTRLSP